MAPIKDTPDLSHLSGEEISRVAENLTSGPLKTILANKDDIIGLKTDELTKLTDLASATRANCGGFGCG